MVKICRLLKGVCVTDCPLDLWEDLQSHGQKKSVMPHGGRVLHKRSLNEGRAWAWAWAWACDGPPDNKRRQTAMTLYYIYRRLSLSLSLSWSLSALPISYRLLRL